MFFFVACLGDQPVSYRCLSTRVHGEAARVLRLRPDQLFVVDEFTVPDMRRRGITRQLAIAMNPPLREQGFRQVIGVHHTDNVDTIAATRRKGIVTLGTLMRLRIAWMTRFSWAPAVPGAEAPPGLAPVPPLALPGGAVDRRVRTPRAGRPRAA